MTRVYTGNAVPLGDQIPAPVFISRRQFFQVLALKGYITKEEALNAVALNDLPAEFEALIAQIPDEDIRWEAFMVLKGAGDFDRTNAFVDYFRAMKGIPIEEMIDMWRVGFTL